MIVQNEKVKIDLKEVTKDELEKWEKKMSVKVKGRGLFVPTPYIIIKSSDVLGLYTKGYFKKTRYSEGGEVSIIDKNGTKQYIATVIEQ